MKKKITMIIAIALHKMFLKNKNGLNMDTSLRYKNDTT